MVLNNLWFLTTVRNHSQKYNIYLLIGAKKNEKKREFLTK
jgi:hypothetical protein